MKGEPLQKPPPLLLPNKNHPRMIQERAVNRFSSAKYDNYSGIFKRVADMKLNMDYDETTTESSEKSESSSVRTRSSRSSGQAYTSGFDEPGSPFEDASSSSSVTGSDHCSPYEEIPRCAKNRYSSSSLPSPPPSAKTIGLHSFRDDLPSPPSPTVLYSNEHINLSGRSSVDSQYSNIEVIRRRTSRPTSLYSNCEQDYCNTRAPLYSNTTETVIATDVNENQTGEARLVQSLTEGEKRQIEMFYRGLRVDIWVISCLANMYIRFEGRDGNWLFKNQGVPVLIFENGDTKSRSKRRIRIVLAERGTSFPLWQDTIDNLSSYKKDSHAFHTMYLSSDHRQVIGLSFDCPEESERLLKQIETLSSDPENINISVPKKKKKALKVKKMARPLSKKTISEPCMFEHVTAVAAKDKPEYMSLKTLVDQESRKKAANIS